MKVHEIAKMVGEDASQVVSDLGFEARQGAHLKVVEDATARAYIEAKGFEYPDEEISPEPEASEPAKRDARFWCISRWNNLPSRPDERREAIVFNEWVVEYDKASAECAFLRQVDIRDRLQIYEVFPAPYTDDSVRLDFIRFLEGLMYTGQTHSDGASREGQKCALAVLFADMADELPRNVKNSPRKLAVAISEKVSLSIDSFGTEE